jgi:hypothetical protein
MPLLVIIFIINARTRFPYVIFSISPTVGNLHKLSNGFWLLPTKFFDIGFSSDAITESINRFVDGNIFDSV